MPLEPPVKATFLADLAECTWSSNACEKDGHLNYLNPASGAWGFASTPGYYLSEATFNLLGGATANVDGSFTTSGAVSYWLSEQTIDGVTWAVAVAK